MTNEQFVEELAQRLEQATNRPLQDQSGIDEAIKWAARVIEISKWTETDVDQFLRKMEERLGAVEEIDPRTRMRIKKAQSNTAFMALMAQADLLTAAVKVRKR
jgi:SPX domain protein involved in polyphosphate accumulation